MPTNPPESMQRITAYLAQKSLGGQTLDNTDFGPIFDRATQEYQRLLVRNRSEVLMTLPWVPNKRLR